MQLPPFPGFRPQAFAFLRELAENNNRDWFNERKSTYEDELKWPLQCLVADVANRFGMEGIPMTGDPKKSIFRIYRDTRFSANKNPYKTHVAAVLTDSGSRKEHGGVYIHVEPGNCFLASGVWNPDNKILGQIRAKMVGNPRDFLDLANYLETRDLPLSQHSDGLKRMPRGFEDYADHEIADYLRWKSFIVDRKFTQKSLSKPEFSEAVVEFGRDVLPLLGYFS